MEYIKVSSFDELVTNHLKRQQVHVSSMSYEPFGGGIVVFAIPTAFCLAISSGTIFF